MLNVCLLYIVPAFVTLLYGTTHQSPNEFEHNDDHITLVAEEHGKPPRFFQHSLPVASVHIHCTITCHVFNHTESTPHSEQLWIVRQLLDQVLDSGLSTELPLTNCQLTL